MEAIWLKFTTTGLESVAQLACDCQSLCQMIPNTNLVQVLNLRKWQQNAQGRLSSTELPEQSSAKQGERICLDDFSHGFICNAPSVPGGKHHTTTSTWKSTLGFPAVRRSAGVCPKRSHGFWIAWLAERAGPQEGDKVYMYRGSFLKYSVLFYTF